MKDKLSKSGGKINISGKIYGKISVVLIQSDKFILKKYKDGNGYDNLRCLTSGGGEKGNSDIHLSQQYDINTAFRHLLKMGTDSKLVLDDDESILSRPRWSKFYIEKKSSDGSWMRTYFIGLTGDNFNMGDKFELVVDPSDSKINQDTKERIRYNEEPNGWKGRNIHNMIEYAKKYPITIKEDEGVYKSKSITEIEKTPISFQSGYNDHVDSLKKNLCKKTNTIHIIKSNNDKIDRLVFQDVKPLRTLIDTNNKNLLNASRAGLFLNAIYYPQKSKYSKPQINNELGGYIDDNYIHALEKIGLEIKRPVFIKNNKTIYNIEIPTGIIPFDDFIDLGCSELNKFDMDKDKAILARHQFIIVPFYLDVSKEYVDGLKKTSNIDSGVFINDKSNESGSTEIGLWVFGDYKKELDNINYILHPVQVLEEKDDETEDIKKHKQELKIAEENFEKAKESLDKDISIGKIETQEEAVLSAAAVRASLKTYLDQAERDLIEARNKLKEISKSSISKETTKEATKVGGKIKVMSFNVLAKDFTNHNVKYQGDANNKEKDAITTERYNKSIDLINKSAPDVVCIQECDVKYYNQLSTTYNHKINNNVQGKSIGVAIFSKHKILENTIIPGDNAHCAVYGKININGTDYHIVSIHAPSGSDLDKFKELIVKVKDKVLDKGNFIIAGDFNKKIDDMIDSKKLNEYIKILFSKDVNNTNINETFINKAKETKSYDHMFYYNLNSSDCKAVGDLIYPYDLTKDKETDQALKTDSNGSDHRPIMCEFEIKSGS